MTDAGWMQIPMFAPSVKWSAPDLAHMPSWQDAKRVAIDIECRDDSLSDLGPGVRRGGHMVGISFAIEDGPAHYLPFAHEGGGNLDQAHVIAYITDQSKAFGGIVVGANLQYDLDYLWEAGVEFKRAKQHADVQIAEPMLDELQLQYGLDAILTRRGLPGKDEVELIAHAQAWGVHPKKGLWRLHSGAVGKYATQDTRALHALLRRQETELTDQGLMPAFLTESRVLLALLRMTRRGVRVNVDKLEQIATWADTVITEELARIHHLTGVRASSPMNANQLAPALDHQNIPYTNTAHGNASITAELLNEYRANPVVASISRARKFHKVLTTYVAGVQKHLIGDRIHASFKQMRSGSDDDDADDEGARYGRTASRHPNVQAQPNRDKETGKVWRSIYIPEHGDEWVCGDYSQQEPRWTVHYAEATHCPGAREFGDRFRNDPSTDSHQMFADISGLPREQAKPVFLGLCYNMGGAKLADSLELPTAMIRGRDGREFLGAGPEAQSVIDQFNARVPFVKKLSYLCMDKAKRVGFLVLFDGSRVRFPKDAHGNFDWTYKALNRLIQGNAAKHTKTALLALDDAGLDPRLTVHDEFDFSMNDLARARQAKELMENAVTLSVPAKVDLKIGPNYGELRKQAA